jgi:hypothetical protein
MFKFVATYSFSKVLFFLIQFISVVTLLRFKVFLMFHKNFEKSHSKEKWKLYNSSKEGQQMWKENKCVSFDVSLVMPERALIVQPNDMC